MINRLVFENLRHRKLRTLLSALSIGFQVTMILAVVGLSEGMLKDSADRARGVNADIWVKPPNASLIGMSNATLPEKMIPEFFLKREHIVKAAGSYTVLLSGISTISGIDYKQFTDLAGPFKYIEGGGFRGDYDIIVDRWYAETNHKHVGDTVMALNLKWRVCGVVEPGKLARLFVPLSTLQYVNAAPGKISQVMLKVDDTKNTSAVIAALKQDLADYSIASIQEFISMFSPDRVPGLNAFITVVICLSIVIGFLVVSLTMYTTVLERTREIGILKALGASPSNIMALLIRETLLLAIGGWLVGIVMSFAANWAINRFVHASLQSVIVPLWWPRVALVAIVAALLGALYPGLRAARQDAIEALAYE